MLRRLAPTYDEGLHPGPEHWVPSPGVWFCLDSSLTLDKVPGDWLLYNNVYYLVWDEAQFGRVLAWHAQPKF